MTYEVLMVSRGAIDLSDGERPIRVSGEALLPAADNGPAFVVYVGSMSYVAPPHDDRPIDAITRQAVISAIAAYFSSRHMTVDFEP
ncbi:Imm74 family immunity protein [Burkholderia sp. AU45388]|uniref:Imm74 family immunity protein n=1 Tax=Burkholderia sp. AU45388 TaxID=3059206 RepID=UPI0026554A82|nr:Imm74 family immunity protein [Burkholderia sp. AU45388]MDN7429791.1 Imm74 family immunity protein [Burkholderia sp. AU45388]